MTWYQFKHALADRRAGRWHDYSYAHRRPLITIELWLRRRSCRRHGHHWYSAPLSWKSWCAVCFAPTPESVIEERKAEYVEWTT